MEQEPKAITFYVQLKTQETKELRRSDRIHYVSLRYQLPLEADDNQLLVFDDPFNYMEAISNNQYK